MLKVGDLTQNQSNSIFSDSSSIKLIPIVSAEWNQNIFNPPHFTSSGDAQLFSIGNIYNADPFSTTEVQDVTDPNLAKPNFITKSIITSNGKFTTYAVINNPQEIISQYNKVVFFAKTDSDLPLTITAYPQKIEVYDTPVIYSSGSASVEIDSFGWTKIELYTYHEEAISEMRLSINGNTMSNDDTEHTVYITVPQYSDITEFDYQYHSVYSSDHVFSNFRPGESYIRTGNNSYQFPDNFRKVKAQIFNTETLSGEYYGNKYMPVSSIINNPSFALATVPVPFYKHSLVSSMSPYKYFVSDIGSVKNPQISAMYEKTVYTNKLVIKFNTLMSVPTINLFIDGIMQTVDASTEIIPDDNGVLILYWTGSAWSKTTQWSDMPKFNEDGALTKYTTFTRIAIKQIGKTIRSSFTAYSNTSTSVSNDLTRMQIIEVSPRLEIDLSDYIENISINKSLDASNNIIPISSIASDDASIAISNIPINKANYLLPLFSSQSDLNETLLKNILTKNIKFYINFRVDSYSKTSENSFTTSGKLIPGGVFYSDSWQENNEDTVTVQCYDVFRYLQSTPVPDYVANLKSIFEIITNILELAGYTDYDYDSLHDICNSKNLSLDLAYYYCNSQDKTLISALSEIFLAYQIGAYIDEYGIMKFISLSKTLKNSSSDLVITDNNVVSNGYSVNKGSKPGKISLRYQPPKTKQSPSVKNIRDKDLNSSSFVYTTSNDVVWSQQITDTVNYNLLSENFLETDNSFSYNVGQVENILTTFNLDANNYAIIEDEIVSFVYKEYTISNSNGSTTVSVKNNTELQSEVSKFIKKYQGQLVVSDGSSSPDYDSTVELTGKITNVKRGLFGTKVKDHKLVSQQYGGYNEKDLNEVNCSSSYVISTGSPFDVQTLDNKLVLKPDANSKILLYPSIDRDNGYKTYSTSFDFSPSFPPNDVSSAGLFFNLESESNTENAYFLELTRYNLFGNVGAPDYKYIIALYYINGGTEKIIAWTDITPSVKKMLANSPSDSFNLRLCHYPSVAGDGEDTGELVDVFLNSFKISGWAIPKPGVQLSSEISYIEQASSLTLKIYTNNTFAIDDNVRITGVVPSEYNIISSVISRTDSYIIVYGLFDSAYMYGGLVTKISSDFDSAWTTIGTNLITKMSKKICLPTSIQSNTIYGHFSTTKSIASTMRLVDNYSMIPVSTKNFSTRFMELYACEKPLKEMSVNYYYQDREFLNGIVQGYGVDNIKTHRVQTKIAISGLNIYDVQYTNPAAVSVDVLPIEYLMQYFTKRNGKTERNEIFVKENALSYSTPLNTGFRSKMAITNNSPHLVYLSKDPTATEQVAIKLNLWTHEIIAASDQQIIEKIIDTGNSSEVIQIDSEWIQSKEAAYQVLNLISKSIDGFSTAVDLEIFGNPLIQIGDKITLTYTKSGINQQQYFIKAISHSFEQGLTTRLSLIKISNGIAYSIGNSVAKIVISPSIPYGTPINKQQFIATAYDKYNNILSTPPTFSWYTSSGTISQSGYYEASVDKDVVEVVATSGSISGSIEFASSGTKSTIYLDEKGGASIPNIQYSLGSSVQLPSTTKSGYNFLGWTLKDKMYDPILPSIFYPVEHPEWSIALNSLTGYIVPTLGVINNKFIMLLSNNSTYFYSDSLSTWTQGLLPYAVLNNTVIKTNDSLCYFGADNPYYYFVRSTDGISWTSNTISSYISLYSGDAVYGNDKFVSVSYLNASSPSEIFSSYYSTDGISWTNNSSLTRSYYTSLAYGNNIFVAVSFGDYDTFNRTNLGARSTDGITWSEITLPGSMGQYRWYSVEYMNNEFFATNTDGYMARSTNGISWTLYQPNIETFGGYDVLSDSIAYGNNTYVAMPVYNPSLAYSSTDAVNWQTEDSLGAGSRFLSLVYNNNTFVAAQESTGDIAYRRPTNDYTLYAKWGSNPPNQYTYNFNFENTMNAYAWLYPSSTNGTPDWWVDSWYAYNTSNYPYPPIISQSTEYAHSGSQSMKVEWLPDNSDCPQAQLYINAKEDFPEEIDSISISAWVYVPSGSPDVQLNIGDGQYAATYDPAYITPYASTSVKNQWVNLQLTVPIEDWQYLYTDTWGDLINIEPLSPNSSAGFVYVDDVVVTITSI